MSSACPMSWWWPRPCPGAAQAGTAGPCGALRPSQSSVAGLRQSRASCSQHCPAPPHQQPGAPFIPESQNGLDWEGPRSWSHSTPCHGQEPSTIPGQKMRSPFGSEEQQKPTQNPPKHRLLLPVWQDVVWGWCRAGDQESLRSSRSWDTGGSPQPSCFHWL